MDRNEKCIDYVEIPVTDPAKARDFFVELFGWSTEDWGPDYISFNDGRLDGGFARADEAASSTGVLVIFYSTDLERDRDRVVELGASISQDIFSFRADGDFISSSRQARSSRSGPISGPNNNRR